ncbi:MAG: hypothetical protein GY938_20105 [Ketobacter sp.]|nr:hypothetical protein [Ketobacter sp.]
MNETTNQENAAGAASPNERLAMPEFIEVPICVGFDPVKIVGDARIRIDALPRNPNWVLSLGIEVINADGKYITEYRLVELGLVSDESYKGYVAQKA